MLTDSKAPEMKSCLPQEPFIKFGEGQGAAIDLNLPQNNEFSAYGTIPINTKGINFKDSLKSPLPDPFFSELAALKSSGDATAIAAKIEAKLRAMFNQGEITVVPKETVKRTWISSYNEQTKGYFQDEKVHTSIEYLADFPLVDVVSYLQNQEAKPVVTKMMGVFQLSYQKKVNGTSAKPGLYVVEEYRMAAYLGKYGLGRVVRTFSLLPGEKTTITLKTYRDVTKTQTKSENVLDSFSDTSVKELEDFVQGEQDNKTEDKNTTDFKSRVSFKIPFGGLEGGVNYDVKTESSRSSNVKNLNRALAKHVNTSNANRQVQINTTTTETVKEGDESSTIRELNNINKSRVLNFVFRQLNQQYVTVTYLSDIKIMFANGNPDDTRIVNIEELDNLLADVLDLPNTGSTTYNVSNSPNANFIKGYIINNYCKLYDYDDIEVKPAFIEQRVVTNGNCFVSGFGGIGSSQLIQPQTTSFWRKSKKVEGVVVGSMGKYGVDIKVPGVILEVSENTLKTSSVLVESMLGNTDALDCFNLKIQETESQKGYMELQERTIRLDIEEQRAAKERDKVAAEVEKLEAERAKIAAEAALITNVIGSADVAAKVELAKEMYSKCCPNGTTPHLVP
jgi:hypothetical protein